jgi:hypothetical protein
MRRFLLVVAAVLAAGAASASRQTHEAMVCFDDSPGHICYAEDGNTELYKATRIQGLYADGWRLIAAVQMRNGSLKYFFERPIVEAEQ